MNFLQLLTHDNLRLYDSHILGELQYLLLDESLVNAHPKKS